MSGNGDRLSHDIHCAYLRLPHRIIDIAGRSDQGHPRPVIKFTYPHDLNLWLKPIPIGRWMVPDPRLYQTLL
jgi:hypothetical protein